MAGGAPKHDACIRCLVPHALVTVSDMAGDRGFGIVVADTIEPETARLDLGVA